MDDHDCPVGPLWMITATKEDKKRQMWGGKTDNIVVNLRFTVVDDNNTSIVSKATNDRSKDALENILKFYKESKDGAVACSQPEKYQK